MEYVNLGDLQIKIKIINYKNAPLRTFSRENRPGCGVAFYTVGGQRFRMSDGQEFVTRPGTFFYLPDGCSYTNELTQERTEYYQIDFQLSRDGQPVRLAPQPVLLDEADSERFGLMCKRIYNDCALPEDICRIAVISDLMNILTLFLKKTQYAEKSHSEDFKGIENTVAYIHEQYEKNTTVAALAEMSSQSVSALEQHFLACFGRTPVDYRNSIRIEHACQMLRGGFDISETAARIGFSDRYYFTRCFKKYTGVTPGVYMRKYSEEDQVKL